jgi:hypothetical protein
MVAVFPPAVPGAVTGLLGEYISSSGILDEALISGRVRSMGSGGGSAFLRRRLERPKEVKPGAMAAVLKGG